MTRTLIMVTDDETVRSNAHDDENDVSSVPWSPMRMRVGDHQAADIVTRSFAPTSRRRTPRSRRRQPAAVLGAAGNQHPEAANFWPRRTSRA